MTIAYGTASRTAATSSVSELRASAAIVPAPAAADARLFDLYTGFYQVNPGLILAVSREGNSLFGQLTGQRRLQIFPDSDGKFSYARPPPAGSLSPLPLLASSAPPSWSLTRTAAICGRLGSPPLRKKIESGRIDPARLDAYVGWYELNPSRALAVVRQSDRLFVQETGRPKVEVVADGEQDHSFRR